jgi:hypothetical protein
MRRIVICGLTGCAIFFHITNGTIFEEKKKKKKVEHNKCKSTFQFSNLAKYGHGPPEDGFKGDRNM